MTGVDYVTVDVFTRTRFKGNPLAVIVDARGLDDAAMQQIATEFNYSETTFVLPPDDPANSARVRIFTPTTEVPFAGHPNVGTAYVLGRQGTVFGRPLGNDRLRFEEKAGLVEVELLREDGAVTGAAIVAPRRLDLRETVAEAMIARCASIAQTQVRSAAHAPVIASVGLPFALAELTDLDALAKARPEASAFLEATERYPQDEDRFSLFVYVRPADRPWNLRARMFAPLDNVTEDPATGSASAALAAYLVTLDPRPDLDITVTIDQGVEMGRHSTIMLRVEKVAGIVTKTTISGHCIEVMRGVTQI